MTAEELIREVDAVKPNGFTMAQKRRWLADMENELWSEVLLQDGETGETVQGALMLSDSRLYRLYLTAMIDFGNAEYTKYANAMALYNEAWQSFAARYAERFRPADASAVRTKAVIVTYNDTADTIVVLPSGAAVLEAVCEVTEAFDSDACTLSLVTPGGRVLLGAEDIRPTQTGLYRRRCVYVPEPGYAALTLRFDGGGATTGQARFTLRIQPGKESAYGIGQRNH